MRDDKKRFDELEALRKSVSDLDVRFNSANKWVVSFVRNSRHFMFPADSLRDAIDDALAAG